MAKPKVLKMASCRADFERILQEELYQGGLDLVEELKEESRQLLNKTLENRNSRSGFNNARTTILDSTNRKSPRGIQGKFRTTMTRSGTGTPHKVWHQVSNGLKDHTPKIKKNGGKYYDYPVYEEARTTPKSLEVGSFKGIKGFRRYSANSKKKKKGFAPRYWYRTARDILIKKLESDFNKQEVFTVKITTSE